MMWTAIIPFRGSGRKSRLSSLLSSDQRRQFSLRMFEHVRDVLAACDDVEDMVLLSDISLDGWEGQFVRDEGRGLNAELCQWVGGRSSRPTLVLHADLPLLAPSDLDILLAQAKEATCALASDRHSTGTNALALLDPTGFSFQFGHNSLTLHQQESGGRARIVTTTGLAIDIDTPADYELACRTAPETMKFMSLEEDLADRRR